MGNYRDSCLNGSIVRGTVGSFLVRLPGTDYGGVVDMSPTAIGDKLVMSGSYCRNISTDTFSCDLRTPCPLVITTAANADTWELDISGYDHLGMFRTGKLYKSGTTSGQVSCSNNICWSRINFIRVAAASTVTNRIRIGFCYGNRGLGASDLSNRVATLATTEGGMRFLPLPYTPASASDVTVRCVGAVNGPSSLVTVSPVADTITFTSTGATAGTAWTVSGINTLATDGPFDIAYTQDGFIGPIASAAANAIVVNAWWKNGVAGTPANVGTGGVARNPAIYVVRQPVLCLYDTTNGGLMPGARVLPLASSLQHTGTAGVNLDASTFAFGANVYAEWPFDTEFEVSIKSGTIY